MRKQATTALLMLALASWGTSLAQAAERTHANAVAKTKTIAWRSHDCCAHQAVFLATLALPLQPAGMPCGSEHPCCVRPAPQNVPNLPSAFSQQPPATEFQALAPDIVRAETRTAFLVDFPRTFRDPSRFRVALRI